MFNPQVQVLIFPLFKMILYRIIEGLIPRKYALFMPEIQFSAQGLLLTTPP